MKRNNAPGGRAVRIDNALVEEVFVGNRGEGYLLISHGVPSLNNMIFRELLRLNVSRNTRIRGLRGRNINLRNIEKGMKVNVLHSSAVTRSIPPQAAAIEITLINRIPARSVTTDRIVSIDTRGRFIITGNPSRTEDQIRFNISSKSIIRDQNGRRITLDDLEPGQMVKIEHSDFMTLSRPPQTSAGRIQVLPSF